MTIVRIANSQTIVTLYYIMTIVRLSTPYYVVTIVQILVVKKWNVNDYSHRYASTIRAISYLDYGYILTIVTVCPYYLISPLCVVLTMS